MSFMPYRHVEAGLASLWHATQNREDKLAALHPLIFDGVLRLQ
jgi:hypothetical protein